MLYERGRLAFTHFRKLILEWGSEVGSLYPRIVMTSGENIYFHVGWIIFDFEWPGQCYLAGNGCRVKNS